MSDVIFTSAASTNVILVRTDLLRSGSILEPLKSDVLNMWVALAQTQIAG